MHASWSLARVKPPCVPGDSLPKWAGSGPGCGSDPVGVAVRLQYARIESIERAQGSRPTSSDRTFLVTAPFYLAFREVWIKFGDTWLTAVRTRDTWSLSTPSCRTSSRSGC
eukprot:1884755-Prymnesium_polylepis.2